MRPFDDAEVALVRALVERPQALPAHREQTLRWALNLARLWILETPDGPVVVGPKLSAFRERMRRRIPAFLTLPMDWTDLGTEAGIVEGELREVRDQLLTEFAGRVSAEQLNRELGEKALVLAVGGGGGCGYVHLGAFVLLEELGLRPSLISGASMGAMVGLFRARERSFREAMARAVTHQLSYKRIFRVLDAETRYAMPGAFRLHLRSTLARFFVSERGETMRLDDLEIPFISVVTGLEREAMRDVQRYERMFLSQLRKGAFARLMHVKDLIQNVAALLQELYATPGALTPVPLGAETGTASFDVIDAVGFSAAVPAILQYDITRDDPRMHELMRLTLDRYGVDVLADGGLVANVPARLAWEHVQLGRIGKRNAFILGLDCFAPQMGRNVLFVPLQRVVALNVARDLPFMHLIFRYRRLLSATSLVPRPRAINLAVANGHAELATQAPFIKRMMTPLSPRWHRSGH